MSKQRMVPNDRNANIKRAPILLPHALFSLLSCFSFLSVRLFLPTIFCIQFFSFSFVLFFFQDGLQPVQPLPLSVKVPLCASAASFWPDLHTLWSSILYIADALWCIGLYGRKVPPGTVSNGMPLKKMHTDTTVQAPVRARAYTHQHKSQPWQSLT